MGGSLRVKAEDVDEAVAHYRHALDLWHEQVGPEHPIGAAIRLNLGLALWKADELAEAEHHIRAAVSRQEQSLAANDPRLASSRHALGSLLLSRQRDSREAVHHLERAWEVRSATEHPPELAAQTAFAFGRALWKSGERRRAVKMIRQADELFAAATVDHPEHAEVVRWLEDHAR